MIVYAYYRVSTGTQDYESQKIGVIEYAKRNGITIDKEIIDDVLTIRKVNERQKNRRSGF